MVVFRCIEEWRVVWAHQTVRNQMVSRLKLPVLKRVLEPMWLLALSGREPCVNAWSFGLVFMCQICSASLGRYTYLCVYVSMFIQTVMRCHEFLMWQWATGSFRLSAARMIQLNISNCSLNSAPPWTSVFCGYPHVNSYNVCPASFLYHMADAKRARREQRTF